MKIEHIAFNVADPAAVAAWYCQHLGLKIVRYLPQPAETHFLADDNEESMIEFYCNPANEVPDYAMMNPLLLHLAFVSECPDSDRTRLVAAGASEVDEIRRPDGTHLVMLRDPWGLALQICKRAEPIVRKA